MSKNTLSHCFFNHKLRNLKNVLKISNGTLHPGKTLEKRQRAVDMFMAGILARDVARHFNRDESTISRLRQLLQQTGNVADRPRLVRPRKTTPREESFITTSFRRNRLMSSQDKPVSFGMFLGPEFVSKRSDTSCAQFE